MATAWRDLIIDQLDFYWEAHLWPRIQGLGDDEFLWEPVEGAWSVREADDGTVLIESAVPEPPVPPVTTIAWRMAHVGRDVLGKRARALFGVSTAPTDADMFDQRHWPESLPLTAEGGLALLKQGYTLWQDGLATLDDEDLLRPIGPKGGPFGNESMAALATHLNRETMAHGAEICLLRDLYRAKVEHGDPVIRLSYAGVAWDVNRRLRWRGGLARVPHHHPSLLADVAALHHWDTVRVLIEWGFPASSATGTGATALHYVAANGLLDLAAFLIEHGADSGATETGFGLDAAGWADHFGHTDLATFLRHSRERRGISDEARRPQGAS